MNDLVNLRKEIDRLDESLVDILARRFRVTREIGQLKKAHNLPAVDAQREAQQAQKIKDLAGKSGLREDVALKVLRTIIDEVISEHRKI